MLLSNTVQTPIIAMTIMPAAYRSGRAADGNYVVVRWGSVTGRCSLLEGSNLVVSRRTLDVNLRRYLISKEELLAAVRRQGARNLEDVDAAVLEANGTLTIEQVDRTGAVLRRLDRIEAMLADAHQRSARHPRRRRLRHRPQPHRGGIDA